MNKDIYGKGLLIKENNLFCEKCNHTGLLPFKNKEGKIVPHAFLDCECNLQSGQTDYIALHPNEDAFDFPCSYAWRAYYEETHYGRYLPYIEPKEKPPQDVEVRYIHHNVNDTRRVFAKLNALDGAMKYLLKKEEQKGGKKKFPSSYF